MSYVVLMLLFVGRFMAKRRLLLPALNFFIAP